MVRGTPERSLCFQMADHSLATNWFDVSSVHLHRLGVPESQDTHSMSIRRCSQIDNSYSSEWWSISLPRGWSISEESDSVSLRRATQDGVLRVSAVRKPDGCVVEADFSEFIGQPSEGCSTLQSIQTERYSGFSRDCERDGLALSEWWLAHGSVLVYFSYERMTGLEIDESGDVQRIIESARIGELSSAF